MLEVAWRFFKRRVKSYFTEFGGMGALRVSKQHPRLDISEQNDHNSGVPTSVRLEGFR